MNFPEPDVCNRNIGVTFDKDGSAVIKVWAPFAKQMMLLLSDKKQISLKKTDFGYWQTTTSDLQPGDQYQFLVDGKTLPDPASLSQPEGVQGLSQAIDLKNFSWTDNHWQNPDQQDYISYELHIGTFTKEGDLASAEKKLDQLLSLGITAVELMPVAQFSGNRNWGYDGVFPFAVQNTYGGASALQHFVNLCHKKGIAVVLDVVYNHVGPEGNVFREYGPYFTQKYQTPWGDAINFDDEYCDAVRRFFIENALMWLRDFHVDALRLDAVHAIKDFGSKHFLQELKENANQLCNQTQKKHYLIAECDLNDPKYIDPIKKRGYGMDAQWDDEFHHALHVCAGGNRSGYYADFDNVEQLAKAYRDAYVYDGFYAAHRKKTFGQPSSNPGDQFVVFSQNHDQVGNRKLGERSSQLFTFEMQKLMAAAVFIAPFLPLLFMGEEYGETNPFLYFADHQNPELIKKVRKGRTEEFPDSSGEAPDPFDLKTFENSKLQAGLLADDTHKTLFNYYRQLISLRKKTPALNRLNRQSLEVYADKNSSTITLKRWHGEQKLICFLNFSNRLQSFRLTEEELSWTKILSSAEQKWLGPGDFEVTGKSLGLKPQSIAIYCNQS